MLVIRVLQKDEFSELIQTLENENWYVEKFHLESLYLEFKDDFFVALLDATVVGFIQALRYSDDFAFISNLIIKKEFRSRGFSKELFSYAMHHLAKRQVALECAKSSEDFYIKNAFTSYYDSVYYIYEVQEKISFTSQQKVSAKLNEKSLYLFNKKLMQEKFSRYLNTIIISNKSIFRAIYNEKKISSYALSTKYKDGYKFSIFSKDNEESLALFLNLSKNYPELTKIYMEVTKLESSLLSIIEVLKMKEYSRMTRMYNKVL